MRVCLAIPGEIQEIDGKEARAEFWDVEKWVRLDIVGDTVSEGDYILNHAGFAIRKLPDEQVEQTLEIYESFLDGDEDDALEEIGAPDADLGLQRDHASTAEPDPPSGPAGAAAPGPMGTDPEPPGDGNE
jgi:hydrogenase expression/formation protein HypC